MSAQGINKKLLTVCMLSLLWLSNATQAGVFGYQENMRSNLDIFPQWLSVLERYIKESAPEGNCETQQLDSCHVRNWLLFLQEIRQLPDAEKIKKVNQFANQHEYILDIDNYGLEDYWAIPKEFLYNNGDCEDYAIIKMLSLKMIGFDMRRVRLLVLQDTNLRVPHAVLAIDSENDTLILDNQIEEVVSHKYILHYVPIYAVNEDRWWMFLPN